MELETMKKVYINVFDWGVANTIYTTKKEADKEAKDRNIFICIETYLTLNQLKEYRELKRANSRNKEWILDVKIKESKN